MIASLVAFSIDIVLQEPLVQLGKVIVLFIWKLGSDSARSIVVASVAARAGIESSASGAAEPESRIGMHGSGSGLADERTSGATLAATKGERKSQSRSLTAPADGVTLEDFILQG